MKIEEIEELLRPNIRSLKAYSSARNEYTGSASILLDANESPYNLPLNRYPDPGQAELKSQLAGYLGLDTSRIFLGNGSDEGIDLLMRAFGSPGKDSILIPEPSYGMYEVCADINDLNCTKVPLRPDFSLDAKAFLDKTLSLSPKLIFLCSPNNPSGNLLEKESIIEILEASKSIVVLDEAYIDFSKGEGCLELLENYPNLVILRTLSKAWGLAGLRVGMVLAHPAIIKVLSAVKYPYNLNVLSQQYALSFLRDAADTMQTQVDSILAERKALNEALENMEEVEKVFPSDANFLLVRFRDSKTVFEALKAGGVIVRDRSSQLHCEDCLRITIGSPEENKKLIETLNQKVV